MILYWAWPPEGAGHAVRAAAVCRHLRNDVLVIRGLDDPKVNRALDHFDIPYLVMENRTAAERYVIQNHRNDFIVLDDYPRTTVSNYADLYIWRMNRDERTPYPIPTIRMEGPDGFWPILMLDDDEILSREDARDALGIPQDEFCIIGVASTARPGVVEMTKPDFMLNPDNFWPALKYLRAADQIVGCPGANLYGEVSYLGIKTHWVKAPHAPDQGVRLASEAASAPMKGAAKLIAAMIDNHHDAVMATC